ncbi:hypothetical protein COT48_01485 [Candidatus Woesearchaeota archaeon CG08_land_8_20_14_0_20_47_9]|nr:MAG: hypothetical protein COV22_00760 [Candidatus Woesearchaeota archaeon CG10_big_fil_rev_8_21_14_0_10_47_5]PIO04233.1 MAG: hypothetical protein COT48_01485 [Candidatus Woesearchaeota archaeon CG08_land_8_20_14_0_20_47_9]HII30171.1 hypothetical protein [Candidatus Woesearchaeota archaeon]
MQNRFVMVCGMDGAGKGVVVEALKEWAVKKNLKAVDVTELSKERDVIPEFSEISDYDVILSAEPAFTMIGKVIRGEIVKKNSRHYSSVSTAHAFALDREILYKRLIIPALDAGKTIFQDRGVVTSLVYQPIQSEKDSDGGRITREEVMALPGNRLALEHPPGLLILVITRPEVAVERLSKRSKKDDAIYDQVAFQKKVLGVYESEWLRQIFESKGTKVCYINTDPPKTVEDTKREAVEVWEGFVCNSKPSQLRLQERLERY